LGRMTKAAIPDCHLVEIEGAGHLPQVQSFDSYWQALQGFLRGSSR
jgi:pimeloyl-ACP methyl ester carboxylesterase